jgi:glycosyltransferase involved in cell wall biosynthesis
VPILSIIIPCRNEAGNLPILLDEIAGACDGLADYEIVVVDDGSTDDSRAVLAAERQRRPRLRVLRHPRGAGQSAAIHSGVRAARGAVCCMLDGDLQNPPAELPKLFLPLLAPGSDRLGLVAGQRIGRRDSLSKRAASRLANGIRSGLLRDGTRDTGCGLKGFRREAYLALPYFDHMHRFLPALFSRDGWEILRVDVTHRPRGSGRSNYSNLQRGLVGMIDLVGVLWLIRRRKKAVPQEEEG